VVRLVVTTRRARQNRRADLRLRLVARQRHEKTRIRDLAIDKCEPRMAKLRRELQGERDIDEARLAGEHVTGLSSVTSDDDRRATVTRDRAACHGGHRGLEDHRWHREGNTCKTMGTCGRLEAVL
jgi:hypothetical protein